MQRTTRQRRVILEEIRRIKSHPTADEVYEMVRRRLPRISLGTVYRNLDTLSRSGMIRTVGGGVQRRYEGDLNPHTHIRCNGCSLLADADSAGDGDVVLPPPPHGFTVTGYHIEYLGLCGPCKEKESGT